LTEILRSGIILSGGRSLRLGQDKGLIDLGGKPLVGWVIERLQRVVDEVIVVVGSEDVIPLYWSAVPDNVHVVADCYPEDSPLIGLITGLREAKGEYAAVCACDMPFIDPTILEMLFCVSYGLNGTLLLKPNGWIEPIPSVYHVSHCMRYAEVLRGLGEMRIRKVLETMTDTVTLSVEKLRVIDPDLVSFDDLDTFDSIEEARRLLLKTS
jgi:molybdopterin-guanine dinucleotide biosynthesis protein A